MQFGKQERFERLTNAEFEKEESKPAGPLEINRPTARVWDSPNHE
jgi:hypothetical protein